MPVSQNEVLRAPEQQEIQTTRAQLRLPGLLWCQIKVQVLFLMADSALSKRAYAESSRR